MKKNQSVIFNVHEDIPYIESEILRTHTISPRVTPRTVLTEYLLYLLEGLNDPDSRMQTAQQLIAASNGDVDLEAAHRIVTAISGRHTRHVACNIGTIQFSQNWYMDHMAHSFMVFRNNLDRIQRAGDVYDRDRIDRLRSDGVF